MAIRLLVAFETEPQVWVNLQAQHDLWVASRKKPPNVKSLRPTIPFDHALETTSPRNRFVFPTRELAGWTVRPEQCNAHSLAGAFLDRLRA